MSMIWYVSHRLYDEVDLLDKSQMNAEQEQQITEVFVKFEEIDVAFSVAKNKTVGVKTIPTFNCLDESDD